MSNEDAASLVEKLTPREREVLALMAQGKSNRVMAEMLVLSVHTVKWHNRQIYGKLGVANRQEAVARARTLGLVRGSNETGRVRLPASTMPLVGREAEVAEVCNLFLSGRSRLVTVVGPGGVGKTHLALEVARRLQDRCADGAAFVDLAPLRTTEAIVPSLAQALGFRPAGGAEKTDPKMQLMDYLRDKELLIVLDNFEHLQESATLLIDILVNAPKILLLVTSRERLSLHLAHPYRLRGLAISNLETFEQAQDSAAVALFLRHGQRLQPDFELRETELRAMRRILQLVRGMPLGIILAATWVDFLSLPQIAAEIERSVDFLEAEFHDLPQRQRSMRAVFESTWSRLSKRDGEIMAALSVFCGGFSLAAAHSVCGASPRDLRRLRDHSLITVDAAGRFGVHELLRQFAAEQLADGGIEGEALDRHSAYYMTFLSNQQRRLTDVRAEESQLAIEADFQNCAAAWARAVEQQAIAVLGAAAFSLATFCQRAVRLQEGLEAIESAIRSARLQRSQSPSIEASILISLIRLLIVECVLRFESGEFEDAEAVGQEALALLASPELGNVDVNREKGLALLYLANVYLWQDRVAEAQVMLHKSVSLLQAADEIWHRALAFRFLGHAANRLADYDTSVQYDRQAVQLLTMLGDRHERAVAQVALGYSLSFVGEEDESEKRMRESIAAFQEMGDRAGAAMAMLFLSETIAYRGRFQEARDLAHESTEVQTRLGRRNFAAMSKIRWCLSLLHLGDYHAVLAQTPDVLRVASANRAQMNRGRVLFLSGSAKLALDRQEEALQEIGEATAILRQIASWDYLCEALAVLSCACARRGSVEEAKEALIEASELARDVRSSLLNTHVVAAAALFSLATDDPMGAVENYAVASRDRFVARSRWWEDVVGRHVAAAAETLPAGGAPAVKSLERDSEELVAEIMRQLRDSGGVSQ